MSLRFFRRAGHRVLCFSILALTSATAVHAVSFGTVSKQSVDGQLALSPATTFHVSSFSDVSKQIVDERLAVSLLEESLKKRANLDITLSEEARARASLNAFSAGRLCQQAPPTPVIEPDRSLFVHDQATLESGSGDFSLRHTLDTLALQAQAAGVPGANATDIFRELWDTQNQGPGLALGAQCDDQAMPDGSPALNGFPLSCRSQEGDQANGNDGITPDDYMDSYRPIALVNRFDLADQNWRSCGEYRIVYGKDPAMGPGRNFMIFEAVLPNPLPGCRDACRPVADFWADLSLIHDPSVRAAELEDFYYNGLPGFRPVVHVDHYSFGTSTAYGSSDGGQIRTNQFMQSPWLLKEIKLAVSCDAGGGNCELDTVPVTVKGNPYGQLFAMLSPASPFFAESLDFQADFTTQLDNLATTDINGFFYANADAHNAGESNAQGSPIQDYVNQIGLGNPLFKQTLDIHLSNLGHTRFAGRALALSCGGCHAPAFYGLTSPGSIADPADPIAAPVSSFAPTGLTDTWPASRGFVHTDETPIAGEYPLSEALEEVFLPARQDNLEAYLASPICPCNRIFPRLPEALLPKAVRIQDLVQEKFIPDIEDVLGKLSRTKLAPETLPEIRELRAQGGKLFREMDDGLVEALNSQRIPAKALQSRLDVKVQALTLDTGTLGGQEAERVRIQQIQALDAAEPLVPTASGIIRHH